MASATEADIEALKAEIKELRAQFSDVGQILKDLARHGQAEASEKVREAAGRVWNEATNRAAGLTHKIEEQPVNAALIALGIGVLAGFMFNGRHCKHCRG